MKRRTARKILIANAAVAVVDVVTGRATESLINSIARLSGLAIGIDMEPRRPIDERIARLDDARAALAEGLNAIAELREDAERTKAEHADVVAALQMTLANREDAEKKLAAVRAIIAQDVDAFRQVAGVSDVRKERLIGFTSGILASVIASAIWAWGPDLLRVAGKLLVRH